MVKVITYGTYDLLHHGHIRLLKRAKALGDYLIVGVTSDDFDKNRGKINVKQSLMERVEAIRATGIADEIIVEEYDGQKIDDILRHEIDIFTVGSDWFGCFDYLREYCKVVYLERTEGVSSTQLRANSLSIKLGLVGESPILNKMENECSFVNGINVEAVYSEYCGNLSYNLQMLAKKQSDFVTFLSNVDAVYIASHPRKHYQQIRQALEQRKHVICESPICLNPLECEELYHLAQTNDCVLMEGLKTAYATAYARLLLLVKSGKIGDVVSVDATCTSLVNLDDITDIAKANTWNSICAWGPTAMLPVFQIIGTNFTTKRITSAFYDAEKTIDLFTKIDFLYPHAVASIKVGKGVKSEGELVISGTKGYVYVPAPWWKTDYFEVRYEKATENKRLFYQLDGEGIRYELVAFVKMIDTKQYRPNIELQVTKAITQVIHDFTIGIDRDDISLIGGKNLL